ncbi:D-alanyl-D-alanine carboxypeptidase family protein [Jiangella alkaliphila]|nr:D-alanyl-D-alanine carboxypeptidase family protein [Jiangella alkaliphila]
MELTVEEEAEEFEAYDAFEPSFEADAYDEAESAEDRLLEEAPAGEHPLAAVFTLPRLAFDAMARGGWATAVATAAGAGLRDVNQLTNMVFWFRHPQLIGQKLRPDQRDLAREWLRIRDEVVRPALAGDQRPAPTPSPSPAAPLTPSAGGRTSIPPDGLEWFGPPGQKTPELMAFMRKVYDLHVRRSRGNFVDTLPRSALDDVEDGHKARKDAAAKARELLAAARAKLAAEGRSGEIRIGVLSGYRSADRQFAIWQGQTTKGRGGFPHYYAKTREARRSAKYGGEHSDAAAAYLAQYMGQYVAAPGYSNHQDGLALDLGIGAATGRLGRLSERSWLYKWLKDNAHIYRFKPLASEAWHWTFQPAGGSQQEAVQGSSEAPASSAIPAGRLEVDRLPLLAAHRGQAPDLVLRWNDMPAVPAEIDVAVHLHGYSWAKMTLPQHMEVWSGLDLAAVDGASGTGRTRPTLTVLPRGHFTGVKSGRIYRYTFPALVTEDGLPALVRAALDRFAARVGGTPPKVGRLILTAHSGGGAPLMQILRRHDPHEVHVFDGLYQDASALADWARRHIRADRATVQAGGAPAGAMRVFAGPSTKGYSLRLHGAIAAELRAAPPSVQARYRVELSRLGHWQIARQYGWRMLADPSADVPDSARPAPARGAPAGELELDTTEMPFLPQEAEEFGEDEDWASADEETELETEGAAGFGEPEFEEPRFQGAEGEEPGSGEAWGTGLEELEPTSGEWP